MSMVTHPKLFEYCMNQLGLREVLAFMGRTSCQGILCAEGVME